MREGNKFRRSGRANGSMGGVSVGKGRIRQWWNGREEIEMPKTCGRNAVASEYDGIVDNDGDSGGGEGNSAASITELAHGE